MGEVISGKGIASRIKSEIAEEVRRIKTRPPKLAVIQVGDDPASSIYVKNKEKACEECGIICENIHLSYDVRQQELLEYVRTLNADDTVDGILVQLPLPSHIDSNVIIETIDPRKDVDGFTAINAGNLFLGKSSLVPCTAAGVVELIKSVCPDLTGKNATVIGRSNTVGKPTVILLEKENATVTVCHSRTPKRDIVHYCANSDIIVVATGQEKTLTGEDLSLSVKNPIIIDVGIHRGEDGKLHGDVSEETKAKYSSYYSPVPMGVGPLTVAMLMGNVFRAYKIANGIKRGNR